MYIYIYIYIYTHTYIYIYCFRYTAFLKKIPRSLIIFKKLRKMTTDFFNNSIFVYTSSEYHQSFFYFRFSRKKPQSQQKTREKHHLSYNTGLLKKRQSFYAPKLTRH